MCACVRVYICAGVRVYICAGVRVYICAGVRVCIGICLPYSRSKASRHMMVCLLAIPAEIICSELMTYMSPFGYVACTG